MARTLPTLPEIVEYITPYFPFLTWIISDPNFKLPTSVIVVLTTSPLSKLN